jgi:hypothetical protein
MGGTSGIQKTAWSSTIIELKKPVDVKNRFPQGFNNRNG